MYICDKGEVKDGKNLLSPSTHVNSPTPFQLEHKAEGTFLIKTPLHDKVFDSTNAGTLVLYDKGGQDTQAFQIRLIDHKKALLVNRNQCVTYDKEHSQYIYKACTLSDDSKFVVLST
jgi:hypothetical protein